MDELAFSLNGENMHYGTPVNPAAPGHIPGGSSSGSAVSRGESGSCNHEHVQLRKGHINPTAYM